MRFAFFLAAVASSTLIGCAASPGEEVASSSSNIEDGVSQAAKPDAILIQQAERIVSVKLDRGGNVLGSALSHTFFAGGDTVLHTEIERAEGKTSCATFGTDAWSTTDIRVSAENGGDEFMFVTALPAPKADEYLYRSHGGEVTGIVGPYAFIVETQSYMGCGAAHPSFGRTATIRDLKHSAAKVTFTAPESAAASARSTLEGKGFAGEEVTLAEIVPRFDENGRLSLTYRFEKPASHVDADGQGNDYSVSALVESGAIDAPLPEGLEALREPPAAVRAYLDANPGQGATNPIKGWSTPE